MYIAKKKQKKVKNRVFVPVILSVPYMVRSVLCGMCMFYVCEFREGSVRAYVCELNGK